MNDNWVKESATVAVKVALSFDPNRVARERVVAQAEKDLSRAAQRISGAYRIEAGEAKLLPTPSDGTGGWIPVSERLPEPDTLGPRVLVRVSGYYYPDIATRFASGEWMARDGRVFRPWEVTHWQPMPAPPPA
jgi:hypothetical protein